MIDPVMALVASLRWQEPATVTGPRRPRRSALRVRVAVRELHRRLRRA
jgi:hypothetical protein